MYAKTLLVGVGAAIGAAILWFCAAFLAPIFLPYWIGRLRGTGGAGGASIGSGSILLAALMGFLLGALWEFRRLRAG